MDVVFFRAIAKFITDALVSYPVNVFIDEEVNREDKYPAIYMIDIDEEQEALGCGRVDWKERVVDEKDISNVVKTGKIYNYKPTVRFTVVSPGDTNDTGGALVSKIAKDLDHAFVDLKKKLATVALVDPVSDDEIILTYIKQLSLVSLPPDIGGEPVLYQRALSFRFTYQWHYEQAVANTMKRIIVVYPTELT